MDRSIEYAKMQYGWITKCLSDDEKWEELAFFKMGVDLGIRISEIRDVKWEQVEFPLIKGIKMSKKDSTREEHYSPLFISRSTFESLNKIFDKSVAGYIFRYNPFHYLGSITDSIGTEFNGHTMIKMNIIFRVLKQ